MNLPVEYALSRFFPSPAFEQIYSEAVANALDAEATHISISIKMDAYHKVDTLQLVIRDNGIGFTDENFERFSNLMKVRDKQHKGLGRLIYLQYFKSVEVESIYSGGGYRHFLFEDKIVEKGDSRDNKESVPTFSELRFDTFRGTQLKAYSNVVPSAIKRQLLDLFMPTLFALKKKGKDFQIAIALDAKEENRAKGFVSGTEYLLPGDLPAFQTKEFNDQFIDGIDSGCRLLYQIEANVSASEHRLITALCVDGRTSSFKIANDDQLPAGTRATFLLESDYLNARTSESRQELQLKPKDEDRIRQAFMGQIADLLNSSIPSVKLRNDEIRKMLDETYPHLVGYFNIKTIGLINRNKAIQDAQEVFCRDEKEILEAGEMNDEQYSKSLGQAARVLAQYILYRNKIIKKMKSLTKDNTEYEIHNLIVPMKRRLESDVFTDDLYRNNAWLLDDKYMTYQTILSDRKLQELIACVSGEEEKKDVELRPDIAFVFSDDIEQVTHPVDVVVVELKRKGLEHLSAYSVIEQIMQRARRLLSLYPTKIQRIWFFGIIDFDKEMRNVLKEQGWKLMYSKGEYYYQELSVLRVDADNNELPGGAVPMPVALLSLGTLWKDAEARNETFLNVLKTAIRAHVNDQAGQ